MNESKLKKLFAAARNEVPPAPSADFADDVLRAVRREPFGRARLSVLDQLNTLFPRLAMTAALIIFLCAAAELVFRTAGMPDPDDNMAQFSAQMDLNGDEI